MLGKILLTPVYCNERCTGFQMLKIQHFCSVLTGLSVTFEDLESVDPALYRGQLLLKRLFSFLILKMLPICCWQPHDVCHLYSTGLLFYKENKLDDDEETDVMFAVDRTFAGELRSVELIPGGSTIMVTESNKLEYIQRMTEYRLTESIHQQL